MMLTSSFPTALMLLIIPAKLAAFSCSTNAVRLCTTNRHHGVRKHTIFTVQASRDQHEAVAVHEESKPGSYIIKVLMDRFEELRSDTSNLHEQHPQSTVAADNVMREISTEQMVKEALLSTRLPLPFLNRSKLGPSKIDGAGRGLFATEKILEGEVITCYPGDALLCEWPSSNNGNDEFDENEEDEYDEEDEYTDDIVLWGDHVSQENRWEDDVVFDGSESTPSLTAYAVSIDDTYSIMGHPALDDNPAYFGHFVNDGAGHLALEKPNSQRNIQAALELGLDIPDDEEIGVEENIAAYVLKSLEVSNAIHKALDEKELHMVTVATRDIEANEEIYVTYGPDYWVGHSC